MSIIWYLLGSYLVGSIPCGYLLGKSQGIDITTQGSGNIGATNALRLFGWQMGLLVLFCDMLKGFIPTVIVKEIFGPGWGGAAGLLVVVGHTWSVFLRLRGGRGAAATAGVLFALLPGLAAISMTIWAIVIALSGYVSLGSIVAASCAPVVALFLHEPWTYFIFLIPAVAIVILRHLPNIKRLRRGTESRIRLF